MSNMKLVSARELAEFLDLSVDTIWRYTRKKIIPYIELGPRQYRYNVEDVLAALHNGTSGVVQDESSDYAETTKLTYADYAKLPAEAGYTTELINGLIFREPSPSFIHQRVSRRLQQILIAYFASTDPKGEVFNAPLDVYFNEYTVVQPDLIYLPSSRPAKNDPVDSLPELVVEILSPSTSRTDRVIKLSVYQEAGIPHYWILDPHEGIIEAYELRNNYYTSIVRYAEGTFIHPSFPDLSFDVDALFAEL